MRKKFLIVTDRIGRGGGELGTMPGTVELLTADEGVVTIA